MSMTFIYAQDMNRGIGYHNQLPWSLPNDLKFFKEQTMGHTIVMGRKTFESMGKRILPGRQTVVVTSTQNYGTDISGLHVVHSIDDIVTLSKTQHLIVIGGSGLFNALWHEVDQIIRTQIFERFNADVFMPEINQAVWQLTKVEQGIVDEYNHYPHQFEWWKKYNQ